MKEIQFISLISLTTLAYEKLKYFKELYKIWEQRVKIINGEFVSTFIINVTQSSFCTWFSFHWSVNNEGDKN